MDEQVAKYVVSVSPNPCSEQIEINFLFHPAGESGIELISAEGKKMLSSSTREQKLLLDTEKLPSGFYFLKLTCRGKSVF
ncbi:MAG: T9SS type A sorting domain-containing protein [Bacteroidia bacterium]|nr:T9SS type A sorting domain-containing protein [Bacteroidia bacterium]